MQIVNINDNKKELLLKIKLKKFININNDFILGLYLSNYY
jgi:hypothetical protein